MEEACLICVRICEGLSYAHELKDPKGRHLQIVHRDMSPPNVLITRFGEVKIVDFGLAKAASQLEQSEPGIIKGKFSYLSPEAAQGQAVDQRTDVFAVGIILWEMLAGKRLFLGQSDLETVRQVQKAEVPSIRLLNPSVPQALEEVLGRALARDPKDRYSSARDLGRDLNRMLFQAGRSVSSFDIATLVESAVTELETKRRKREDRGSIIGSLIDEALFEFTSLERPSGPTVTEGSAPLSLDSFSVQDWSHLGLDPRMLQPKTNHATETEPFNLAALEDEEEAPPPPSSKGPPGSPHQMPEANYDQSGGGGSMWIVVLLVVLAAIGAAAGLYFGGLVSPGF
jgi:serine/threonine-protein kinase